jgi:hypothetical protein
MKLMEIKMTVGNPENFKVQIKTGRDEVDSRVPCDFTNLTLKKLFSWIDSQQVGSLLKAELKKSASRFPHQALPAWQRDFDRHLSKAQSRLRKKKNFSKSVQTQPLEDKGPPKHVEMRATDFGGFDDQEFDDLDHDGTSNELEAIENNEKHVVVTTEITEEFVEDNSVVVADASVVVADATEESEDPRQDSDVPEQTENNERSICEENNI